MSESVFNDLMDSLNEVEEHQCGNINLRTDVVEISDDYFISQFHMLSENDKYFVSNIIDRLLTAAN